MRWFGILDTEGVQEEKEELERQQPRKNLHIKKGMKLVRR
jgi:hypothetical protein